MENAQIYVDFCDLDAMIQLMDQYGDSQFPFSGTTEDGENTLVSVNPDNIAVRVFQSNGWCAIRTLWRDGTTEETFDGRWR